MPACVRDHRCEHDCIRDVRRYQLTAVKALKALFDGFSGVIVTTRRAAGTLGSIGTDLSREDRIRRACLASDLFIASLPVVQSLASQSGSLAWHASELRSALERFCTQ